MKIIVIAFSVIVVILQLYIGFATGKKTLNVKFIDSANTPTPNFEDDSLTGYYIDVTLDNGEKIRIQSTDPILLNFNGGYLYDVESYYSVLRLKTIYVLK
ncbi:MAG: hypothetical protein COB26_07880 [Piscirickettsiaceae bacterium]|nr:MAG: hypothetical protein COB26_07880 [Piscirickettsiaceae bacterium]